MTSEPLGGLPKLVARFRNSWGFRMVEMVSMLTVPMHVSVQYHHAVLMKLAFGYLYLVSNGLLQAVLNNTSLIAILAKFNYLYFAIGAAIVYFTPLATSPVFLGMQPYIILTCSAADAFCRFGTLRSKSHIEQLTHAISRLGSGVCVFYFSNRQKKIKISLLLRSLTISFFAQNCSSELGVFLTTTVDIASGLCKIKRGRSLYDYAAGVPSICVDLLRRIVSK